MQELTKKNELRKRLVNAFSKVHADLHAQAPEWKSRVELMDSAFDETIDLSTEVPSLMISDWIYELPGVGQSIFQYVLPRLLVLSLYKNDGSILFKDELISILNVDGHILESEESDYARTINNATNSQVGDKWVADFKLHEHKAIDLNKSDFALFNHIQINAILDWLNFMKVSSDIYNIKAVNNAVAYWSRSVVNLR
ncbi:hypothetical protein CCAX7_13400 [Capsulimonas corticalis]|uniref:Uncharacterized protein n=1 Tax=Capsulimonas corticalis TaxID=2219043 RepID=A0A402D4L7_9BACT|nr:hypothetical protein [Capsulimonas corticalis]BDI29289.1 hypothetical protein CCAX7_13400 [Capsulimonas corticalis]